MQIETKRVRADGAELHYVERGKGDPVVFVHGSLADFRWWGPQIEPFSQRYRVIAYSRRYHHPNAWVGDGSDYSFALHAEDLAGLITGLELGSANVVAHSGGAYTALLFAAKRPALVRTLVVCEPPLLPWAKTMPEGEALIAPFISSAFEPARQAFHRGDLELGVRAFLDGAIGKGAYDHLPQPAREMVMDNAREMKAETAMTSSELFSSFTRDDARRIKSPTLLVNGELSPKFLIRLTDELERCLPHRERVMIPGASHAMNVENPQAFNEAVLAFLARH